MYFGISSLFVMKSMKGSCGGSLDEEGKYNGLGIPVSCFSTNRTKHTRNLGKPPKS